MHPRFVTQTGIAILGGALIVAISVAWHAERSADLARCAGFLASPAGGDAVQKLALFRYARASRQSYLSDDQVVWRAQNALDLVGCDLKEP